jgi:hypothetical protein
MVQWEQADELLAPYPLLGYFAGNLPLPPTRRTVVAPGNRASEGTLLLLAHLPSHYLFASRDEAIPFMETVPGPSIDELAICCH